MGKESVVRRASLDMGRKFKNKVYIEKRDGVCRIGDTRVSLDSVVYAFRAGLPPESIAQSFPLLNLEQIYGSIAVYLANKSEVDAYLEREEADYEELRTTIHEADPLFYQKLSDARRQLKAS